MKAKRYTEAQIVAKLREAEKMKAEGKSMPEIVKSLEVAQWASAAGELIKQGWFASEGIGSTAPDSSLSADQLQRARTHLSVPANNLNVLAKKLVRLQDKLGLPPGITKQPTYAGAHAIAQLTYLHNGFTDYSPRITETMRAPHLLNALGKIAP